MRERVFLYATPLLLATAAWALCALADEAPERIRLQYSAPASCPGEQAFEESVLSRTNKARAAETADNARTFSVQLREADSRWVAALTIRELDGRLSERQVEGRTCDEVHDAIALIVALAIDPQALASPPSPPPVVPLPSASAPPPPAVPTATPPPPAPAAPARARAPAPRPAPATTAPWSAGLGVQGAATWGPAQGALWTVPLFVELTRGDAGRSFPGLRLSLARGRSDLTQISAGSGRFTWTVARLEGCLTAWSDASGLQLTPCALVEGGTLRGEGSGVDRPKSATRAWLAGGATARLQWLFAGGLFVEGQGSLAVPVIRDRFYLEPDATLHRAPIVVPSVALGLGAHFL